MVAAAERAGRWHPASAPPSGTLVSSPSRSIVAKAAGGSLDRKRSELTSAGLDVPTTARRQAPTTTDEARAAWRAQLGRHAHGRSEGRPRPRRPAPPTASRQCTSGTSGVSLGIVLAMPEAVIVATARSPIGRANKGSLARSVPTTCRPRSYARCWPRCPELDRDRGRGPDHGLRPAGWRAGVQHRARRRRPRRARRRAGRDRQPLLLVEPADDPHGRPRDQGRRGRRLHRRGCGVRQPLRQPGPATPPRTPIFRRGRRAHAKRALGGAATWTPGAGSARHLHRHGPDGRERA